MADEKIFADGFSFKRSENAPDFVVGRLSLKVDDAVSFLRANEKKGWVNLNIKTARSGNHYVELDTFEPKGNGAQPSEQKAPQKATSKPQTTSKVVDDEDLPF